MSSSRNSWVSRAPRSRQSIPSLGGARSNSGSSTSVTFCMRTPVTAVHPHPVDQIEGQVGGRVTVGGVVRGDAMTYMVAVGPARWAAPAGRRCRRAAAVARGRAAGISTVGQARISSPARSRRGSGRRPPARPSTGRAGTGRAGCNAAVSRRAGWRGSRRLAAPAGAALSHSHLPAGVDVGVGVAAAPPWPSPGGADPG